MGLSESLITLDMDSDSDDDDVAPESNNIIVDDTPPPLVVYEVEAVEIFQEKTLEDIIEEQRARLAAQGKTGTPVTAETFAIWRAGKLAKRQADAEARMKELSKKKGGAKALCNTSQPF